jgi:hypothetical protein
MTHPLILHINNSNLFAGCIMILMNIGGKYVSKDVSRAANNILDTKLTRRFLIFCIAFVATRDVVSSIIIMLLFIVIFSYFLNENSNYCILPKKYIINIDQNRDGIISKEEIEKSKKLLDKLSKTQLS